MPDACPGKKALYSLPESDPGPEALIIERILPYLGAHEGHRQFLG
jgi:hypothetical protein